MPKPLERLDTSRWTRGDIIKEAKLQTDAVQRLGVWLRLAYSLVAIGFIVGIWASQAGSTAGIVGSVICLVVGAPCAVLLKLGTTRARRNIKAMLAAAGVDLEDFERRSAAGKEADAADGAARS